MFNFYDFEVFKYDWLVVIIDPTTDTKTVIHNDREALIKYYEAHKNEIWVGYNSRNYDTGILKGILCGFNPKNINDNIIYGGAKVWQIDSRFRDIQLYDYDVMKMQTGLKQLEAFMGNNIKETEVPFDIDRALTPAELEQTIYYCTHDVEQTIEVFMRCKSDFDAQMDLIKTFGLPLSCISRTKAQLTATIIGCRKQERYDEWDLKIVDTLRLNKYKSVLDWFLNPVNHNYDKSLEMEIAGVPHVFGWGGIHGAPAEPIHRKGLILHVDVTSYYPSMMIRYDFLTRNCRNKKKFVEIYDKRVALKKAGKKKEQAPYKIILNGTYGICKDPTNPAYDPQMSNNVCINGQLLLLDLIEKLEGHCELIQSNTDGLIIQVPDTDEAFNTVDDICYEWEQRTGMGLGFDIVTEIWQGDVNNYVFRFDNGKLERKGAYVKELSDLDYDLPIVNEAIVKCLTEGIEPKETINACNEMIKFQKVVKVSSKYKYGWHNGQFQNDKTYRVFASNDPRDTGIYKVKDDNAKPQKFANTPIHCFIYNEDVNNLNVLPKLDKQWYINLAEKRLNDKFGMNFLIKGETEQTEFDFNFEEQKPKKKVTVTREEVKQDLFDIF